MFNCFTKLGTRIKFSSNPPLEDLPEVYPDTSDGIVRNRVRYVPQSNHSFFEGVVFDPSVMSLRAKLNLGVKLQYVPNVSVVNDPTVLQRDAVGLEHQIASRLAEIQSQSQDFSSVVQPQDDGSVV